MGNDSQNEKQIQSKNNFSIEELLKKRNNKKCKEKDSFANNKIRNVDNIKLNLRDDLYEKNNDKSYDYFIEKINKENILLKINKSSNDLKNVFENQKNILISVLGLKKLEKLLY